MALAPLSETSLVGKFRNTETGVWFEFKEAELADRPFGHDFPHKVFVCEGFRWARVLKTVAHIVVDEADDGSAVTEGWHITSRMEFANV